MKFAELMGYIDHVLNFKLFQIQQTPVSVIRASDLESFHFTRQSH